MIARQCQSHHRADRRLAVHGDDAIGDAADGKNCGLRRRDDRIERIDVVHAEIGDRECSVRPHRPASVGRRARVPSVLCALRAMSARAAASALGMTAPTTPSVNSHGDADVDGGIHLDGIACPACVHLRMFLQDTRRERDKKIRMVISSRPYFSRNCEKRARHRGRESGRNGVLESSSASCARPSAGRYALRAGPAAAGAADGLAAAAMTSSLVIVPSGPVPLTRAEIDAFFFSEAARLRRDLRPRFILRSCEASLRGRSR